MPASELLINVEPIETRAALVEDGIVTELHIEREADKSGVGDVYLGKVSRVLPGMQAAFVDIGQDKHAFLQVSDTVRSEDFEALAEVGSEESSHSKRVSKHTPISQVLKQGQEVVVQISRGARGSKGARVTSHVSLAGRYLVFLPTLDRVGVSRRISDDEERRRLARIVEGLRTTGGYIARTAAEGVSKEVLEREMELLSRQWEGVLRRRKKAHAPTLLHADLDLPLRLARDILGESIGRMVVDDEATFERLREFVETVLPDQLGKLALYRGDEPLFDAFGIEEEIRRALERRISLPSGGSLVIDHTEALTAIDVNSGRFTGGKDLEETITQTNLEAVREIAYQLRLRNIGGLIVVDFIDMDRPSNRNRVNKALKEALRGDRAQTTAVEISRFGLVEMTRKGATKSLARALTEPCPTCHGTGRVRSRMTVACDILRALRRRALELRSPRLIVECHPEVARLVGADKELGAAIDEISQRFTKEIDFVERPNYHIERFDIKGGRSRGAAERKT